MGLGFPKHAREYVPVGPVAPSLALYGFGKPNPIAPLDISDISQKEWIDHGTGTENDSKENRYFEKDQRRPFGDSSRCGVGW
jgi:hypothetical protein